VQREQELFAGARKKKEVVFRVLVIRKQMERHDLAPILQSDLARVHEVFAMVDEAYRTFRTMITNHPATDAALCTDLVEWLPHALN
jgi:hypothetical protein